jgi:NifB/MoaA-like Fe-S oxidoreductase
VYHDFATGMYTFTTTSQENNTRFKIVYQNALLGNDNFDSNFTSTTLNDNVLKVNSKVTIDEVKVFDMTGHLVLNVAPENQAISFAADFNQAVGVYIVKVKLTNGQIITSKLINNKN